MDEKEKQKLETKWITECIQMLHKDKVVSLSFIARETGLSQTSITKIMQGKKKRMRIENRQNLSVFLAERFDLQYVEAQPTVLPETQEPIKA